MYTQHASVRCQQRGISPEVVDVLLNYGSRKQRHGAEICFMDHRSRRRALDAMGRARFARVADHLNSYLVVADDGSIVTAAPRLHRLKF